MDDETNTTSEVARVLALTAGEDPIRLVNLGENSAVWKIYHAQATALAEAGLLRDTATIDALNQRCQILVDEGDRLRAQIATQEPAGAPGVDSAGRGASGGLDGAPATDWAKVDHTADQCQFEECPSCGCCAHGKEHVIGCSTTLDRPLGTDCPNTDCACRGGMG